MNIKFITLVFTILVSAGSVFTQTSWLDRPLNNWNGAGGLVPSAPRSTIDERCRTTTRSPESLVDRAVTRAGWLLFGASQTYGPVTLVKAMSSADGMCRPNNYNAFVFVGSRFAGTLSPTPMDARTDGSLREAHLSSTQEITAVFNRYTSSDALCCPSQESAVFYEVTGGTRGVTRATSVDTNTTCRQDGPIQTQDNVITGTVTYRQRSALPSTAVVTVRMVDVSRQDSSSTTIAEQVIETDGKQVPFSFEIVYDQSKIIERNNYAIQAEIRDNGRLLFISDVRYPVLTQGNLRTVDVVVVPVRGGQQGGNQGVGSIRGTITYLQRIALDRDAMVTVKLLESNGSNDGQTPTTISEETFSANNRQVPIPFVLRFQPRRINQQRTYSIEAEITSDGKRIFATKQPVNVLTDGNPLDNVDLVLVADTTGSVITGQTLSLSKFGTGTFRIEDRGDEFVVRGSVNVRPDGTAEVTIFRISGGITFSGRLTHFDAGSIKVQVDNSGNADASGEITVTYSSRRLNSITSANLVLDGQNATINF
ncbi:MAG: YbaY family lipoprotein [Pyrinomonadaceae bacterium]